MSVRSGTQWVGVLVAVLATACSGSRDGDAGASPEVDEIIGATCDWIRTCCEAAGEPLEPLADCEAETEARLALFRARTRKNEPIEPAYSDCVAAMQAGARSCGAGRMDDVCGVTFRGLVAEGGACEDVSECAHDGLPVICLRTDSATDDTPGVCRALARVASAEPCLISGNGEGGVTFSTFQSAADVVLAYCDVRDGLYCGTSTRICQSFIAEGGACEDEGCAAGFYCDATCKPQKTAGAACAASQECAELLCKEAQCGAPLITDGDLCQGDYD